MDKERLADLALRVRNTKRSLDMLEFSLSMKRAALREAEEAVTNMHIAFAEARNALDELIYGSES